MALPDLNRSLIRQSTIPVEPGLKINTYEIATKEASATILAAGFFNFARAYLQPGDRITAFTEVDAPAAGQKPVRIIVLTVPATGNLTVDDVDAA